MWWGRGIIMAMTDRWADKEKKKMETHRGGGGIFPDNGSISERTVKKGH